MLRSGGLTIAVAVRVCVLSVRFWLVVLRYFPVYT